MRVLHIGPLPPPVGGMAVNVEMLLRSQVQRTFPLIHLRSDLIGKTGYSGLLRQFLNLLNGFCLLWAMLLSILTRRPGLVHIHTSSYFGYYEKSVLLLLAGLLGRKTILHIHGGEFAVFFARASRLGKLWIRSSLRRADRVVVLSQAMEAALLAIGVSPPRLAIVENAVYLPERSVLDRAGNGEQIHILFLNRIVPGKGAEQLIEAAALLAASHPEARFRIVGPDSALCQVLREQIQNLGLQNRVILCPPVTGQAKQRAFLESDIYVLPSRAEGLSVAMLEAMSYALPCVVTPVGAVPSILLDGKQALIVPVGDSEALARALARLLGDGALRRRLGMAARELIERRFNWEKVASTRIVELYRDVLHQKPDLLATALPPQVPGSQLEQPAT